MQFVSIIIVTRNREQEILACLASIFAINYSNFEVILVDNGSSDNTVKKVKEKYPKVKIIEAKTNLGASDGKNLGQKYAKGEYLFFLDSDTVVDKNILLELVRVAESDPKIGMVCPKIYYHDQKDVIWYSGAEINLLTSQAKNVGVNEKDLGQHDQIRETFFAPTAYLVTKKAAEKLIGHGEVFFMGYVDSDYGYRIKEAGFRVVFCPKAFLWHRLNKEENIKSIRALGYNLPLRAYYFARNRVVFMKKHATLLNFFLFMFFFFPLMTIYISYKIITFKGNWKFLKPHLEGSIDGIKFALGGKIQNRWK